MAHGWHHHLIKCKFRKHLCKFRKHICRYACKHRAATMTLQSQKAVFAYLYSKQILPFGFARQDICDPATWRWLVYWLVLNRWCWYTCGPIWPLLLKGTRRLQRQESRIRSKRDAIGIIACLNIVASFVCELVWEPLVWSQIKTVAFTRAQNKNTDFLMILAWLCRFMFFKI